ncbi:MAG TPA: permease [Candidatus Wallbacteria bacterium]|nr:permease [Candidatus Wallbacteria bacterium]
MPAFLIAAALKVFVRERSITRYLGPSTSPLISYPFATVIGLLFSACSCGVIPLFSSIFRHGAGIGPAMVFLTTGPAINLLAVILTGQLFGLRLMYYRIFFAIVHGFIVGGLYAFIYRNEKREVRIKQGVALIHDGILDDKEYDSLKDEELDEEYIEKPKSSIAILFAFLVAMMFLGQLDNYGIVIPGIKVSIWTKIELMLLNIVLLAIFVVRNFTREEYICWLERTGHFINKIVRPLVTGLFAIGFAKEFLTASLVVNLVGHNDFRGCLISSLFGVFTYFGTCMSVVIVKFFMEMGMAAGPGLSLFLAGPTVSFSSMLSLVTIMGYKKTILFVLLIVVLSMIAGLTY